MIAENLELIRLLRGRLPITTRDQLRAAGPNRIGRDVDPAACRVMNSSGSSGKPWSVYRTPAADRLRRALELRSMVAAGVHRRDRIAWECAAHEGLHINTDSCIVELEDDVDVPGAGKSVVVTNLNSRAMPYIRYRLGDRCELIKQPCSCGSLLPLMKAPVGREWDVIQLPSGRLISPWGYNAILRELENLQQFRLIQERVDLLVVQLKFSVRPAGSLLNKLQGRLQQHTGEQVTLRIEQLDHFGNEALKFRAFISRLGS